MPTVDINKTKTLARVVLSSDGSVHIAFHGIRSVYATAGNLLEFFSDPIEFIDTGSHAYKDSTFFLNRNRVPLEDVPGLTLASLNSDKQIICDFPELFRYISEKAFDEDQKNKPLSMHDMEYQNIFSDEKSFFLRYYFDFAKSLHTSLQINKQIKLREEVLFAIMREILNAHFFEELPKDTPTADLLSQIEKTESTALLSPSASAGPTWVSVTQYANHYNITPPTVRNYIKDERLKSAYKDSSGRYLIDLNDRPIEWDRRVGRKTKKRDYKRFKLSDNSSAADIQEAILTHKYFTIAIATYIRTNIELQYYLKNNYHEVFWNGRPALIIDVNPDYIVPEHKVPKEVREQFKKDPSKIIRNRDLMKAGFSPVVPDKNKEDYLFDVHHVGCRKTSPFAIIPSYDHNSTSLSAALHQGKSDPNLHDVEFNAHKKVFWKEYIRQYEEAGKYHQIPYLNPYRKRT